LRGLDFSSWQGILSTLVGLAVVTLLGVGIRLLIMQSVQQRRERENRQINERLRTLIAAYKTLGGSFTGDLSVDPTHLRDTRSRDAAPGDATIPAVIGPESTDRSRRVRDSVEAALSDILLLGTEDQVRLAAFAATELASGRPIHTAELVASLRAFIRQVLDLDPIAADVVIPKQGPSRPGAVKSGGAGGEREGKGGGGGGGGGMTGAGAGAGLGLGLGGGMAASHEADEDSHR
jgi:type II secretory pathway pseudopilin PulG